tara:strand:+ start:749 stop:1033 length:285 start_codon:yes stop_codon:yes gene_type:complete
LGIKIEIDLFEWGDIRDKVTHYTFSPQTKPEEVERFCSYSIQDRWYFDHNKGHYNGFAPGYDPYWDGWLWFENKHDALLFKLRYGNYKPSTDKY